MEVKETDLPGVGKKFDIPLREGTYLCILIHNTGRRDIYLREHEDDDGKMVASLTDKESRVVGTVLEGAYFQPIQSDAIQTLLDTETLIEWLKVDADSDMVDKTLEELDLRERTGATVIAIKREEGLSLSPGADEVIRAGDVLITVGPSEGQKRLEELAGGTETA